MKNVFLTFVLLLTTITQTGCIVAGGVLDLALTDKPRLGQKAKLNNENLARLKLGMSKDEMLEIMGTPRSSEVYQIKGEKIELLSYLTKKASFEDHISQRHLTPVALQEGKIIGWGRSYFDNPGEIFSPK